MARSKKLFNAPPRPSGYFVYTLAHPNGDGFYVGKGQGGRAEKHLFEAAAALHVSRRRVLALIKLGTLHAEKFGRDWQVDSVSVEAYKNSPRKAGRKKESIGGGNRTKGRVNANNPAI